LFDTLIIIQESVGNAICNPVEPHVAAANWPCA